jgi:methanogenic corrinoid protein MtbC1
MPDHNISAIIDGAPDTASGLAQQAVSSGVATIDAINHGYVPGMHDVGEQFPAQACSISWREQELIAFALHEAKESGLDGLPGILLPEYGHEPRLI